MKIDKNRVYTIGEYTFINYICLSSDLIHQILEWRNHEEVRQWMYNSDIISYESHVKFVQSLRIREDTYYWLVNYQNNPVGAVYLANVCHETNVAELGMYYRPDQVNHSLFGIEYVYTLYDFVINLLSISKICGHIREDNKNSLTLTLFMGASIEGKIEINQTKYINTLITMDSFNRRTVQQLSAKEYLKFIRQYLNNK